MGRDGCDTRHLHLAPHEPWRPGAGCLTRTDEADVVARMRAGLPEREGSLCPDDHRYLRSFPTRHSSQLETVPVGCICIWLVMNSGAGAQAPFRATTSA